MSDQYKRRKTLTLSASESLKSIHDSTTFLKYHLIKYSVNRLINQETSTIKVKLDRKFDALIVEKRIRDGINENPNELITNLCGRELTNDEVEVLKLGLKHGFAIRPREDEMIVVAENIWEQIERKGFLKL